jgi:N-acetylmuramate 1-kinase
MRPPTTAMILAAGAGVRLRPFTRSRAKPAVPVGGEPIIRRIIAWLAAAGVSDVAINLHHHPETITAVVGDGSDLGVRVRYSWEQPALLGSAGGPRLALPIIGADTFFLVNGDVLTDVDLAGLWAHHWASGAHVTLALVPDRAPDRYGGILVDASGFVVGFAPRGPAPRGAWHFVGAQVVEAGVFRHLPAGERAKTIGGVYDALIASRPGSIAAFRTDAAFWDIGTPEDYLETSRVFVAAASGSPAVPFDPGDAERRIERFVGLELKAYADAALVPLTGDASDRRYVRLIPATGAPIVLALHARPIEIATLPFARLHELFDRMDVPVPRILGHSDALGIMALEDLGDATLQAHLGSADVSDHAARYREAIELLDRIQQRGAELAAPGAPPYNLAFDIEKLSWELDFFRRHFLEGYRGIRLMPAERTALAEEWAAIAEDLASEPRVVCHRDYHSRNLMVHAGRLVVIDFQDARMGPDTYDLASLLRDSYVDIGERELEEGIAHFLALKGGSLDPLTFRRRFDLMAVQRNLKALATFGHQTTHGNPVYAQYVPRTLHYARANLHKYPRFARLIDLLAPHVAELA